jgi:hypothetical protein
MGGSGVGGLAQPHKPTLGWTIGAIIVVVIVYHFTLGRGRK